MSWTEHKSWSLTCDVCKTWFEDDSGFNLWLDRDSAAESAREYEWAISSDLSRAVCPSDEPDHTVPWREVRAAWEADEEKREAEYEERLKLRNSMAQGLRSVAPEMDMATALEIANQELAALRCVAEEKRLEERYASEVLMHWGSGPAGELAQHKGTRIGCGVCEPVDEGS